MESAAPELSQSWNRYSYVLNNPLLFVDPTGLIWGYRDRKDGQREFAWCEGDAACAGYEPYTQDTYTFGDGRVVWFNQEEGTWGVVEPIRPDNSCLNCQGLVSAMQNPETWNRAAVGAVFNVTVGKVVSRALGRGSSPRGVGAMRRLEYESSPKHGQTARGNISAAPRNGQAALDNSVQVKATSPRRVGIDYTTGEIVVFDRTLGSTFHGHVRTWDQLEQGMKNALIKSGMTDARGRVQ